MVSAVRVGRFSMYIGFQSGIDYMIKAGYLSTISRLRVGKE